MTGQTMEPRGEYVVQGRVAVILGGSGGIGAATARRMAAAGATVMVGYHSGSAKAQALAGELTGSGHAAVHLNVADSTSLSEGAAYIEATMGRADILVNASGITSAVPHADLNAMDDASFDRILTVNVRGAFAAVRAFAPLLRRGGDSLIVNVSSISATTGLGSSIAYCASKAALDTMGISLARVLGPEIRVITIAPAAVATGFVPGRGREAVERQAASTPLRKVAEADDIALAIMAAATHFRLTTGSTLVVDGGRHL